MRVSLSSGWSSGADCATVAMNPEKIELDQFLKPLPCR